jgi:hypothetical protein
MKKDKSVRAQINDLTVGHSIDFPLSRYEYIVNCKARLQTCTESRFTSAIDKKRGVVTITKTS